MEWERILQTKVEQAGTFASFGEFSRFGIPTLPPLRRGRLGSFLVDFGPLPLSLTPCGSRWRREGRRCCGRRARSSPYNYGVMVLPWAEPTNQRRNERPKERLQCERESKGARGGRRRASTCCSTTTEAPPPPTKTRSQVAHNRLKSEAPKVGHARTNKNRTLPPSLRRRRETSRVRNT